MGALDGLLVVAVEQAVAAPLCTARLCDAGARVIKVERAEGDFARGYDAAALGESSYFTWLNQGKESVRLDFKRDDDASLLRSMLARADVLVQNLAPGALARAGFGTDVLHAANPRLIVCDVSGYGADGSVAGKRAYDLLVQAESGLISVSGASGAPGRIGVSVCDIGAGMAAHAGVLEALIERSITGRGTALSVSLFDVAAEWMNVPYLHAEHGDGPPAPAGLRHPSIAPYGAFACADGARVLVAVQNEREWVRLCTEVLDAPSMAEDERYASNNRRVANRAALEEEIGRITGAMSSPALRARLDGARIAYGDINGAADLREHPATRLADYRTVDGSLVRAPAGPVRWARRETTSPERRCPRLGEHDAAVRREFGEGPVDGWVEVSTEP